MLYISKGILPWKPKGSVVSVSHCGALHKLSGAQAEFWVLGLHRPGCTRSKEQDAAVLDLAGLGIAEFESSNDGAALFRLLTNCSICPALTRTNLAILTRMERRILRWIRRAGLRLTIAELTLLIEYGIKPIPALLGGDNRQALTEIIYSTETIFDGILETLMEKASSRNRTVKAVMGLLRKKKVFLI